VLCYRNRTLAASGRLLSQVPRLEPPIGFCSTRPSDTPYYLAKCETVAACHRFRLTSVEPTLNSEIQRGEIQAGEGEHVAERRPDVPALSKRLLVEQEGGKCANPGCPHVITQLHHIQEWHVLQGARFGSHDRHLWCLPRRRASGRSPYNRRRSPLVLTDTPQALNCRATLDSRSPSALEVIIATGRGDINQMSVGFIVAEDVGRRHESPHDHAARRAPRR
jgi:hypothetical protein